MGLHSWYSCLGKMATTECGSDSSRQHSLCLPHRQMRCPTSHLRHLDRYRHVQFFVPWSNGALNTSYSTMISSTSKPQTSLTSCAPTARMLLLFSYVATLIMFCNLIPLYFHFLLKRKKNPFNSFLFLHPEAIRFQRR